jgi:hypothetical protein
LTSDQIRADTAVTLFTSLVTHHMSQLLGPDVRSRQKCVQKAAGCQIPAEGRADVNGQIKYFAVSRQMVLFALERRKAGVANKDYQAQKALLAKLDKGEIQLADVQGKTKELFEAELAKLN